MSEQGQEERRSDERLGQTSSAGDKASADALLCVLGRIAQAFEAWENDDHDFGHETFSERSFHCDADFVAYMGALAKGAIANV